IFYLLKYLKFKTSGSLAIFFCYGLIGAVFHTGVFALFFGFLIYQFILNRRSGLIAKIFVSACCVIGLYIINQTGIGLSKFCGCFQAGFELIQEGTGELVSHAEANYPNWLLLKGNLSDFLIIPIRFIAFFFAPIFPLMLRSTSHLIGAIDVLFYPDILLL